jgi:hypothetical protein
LAKQHLVSSTNHEAQYTVLSSLLYLLPLRPKYPPQHPVFKHQPVFLHYCDRPSSIPISTTDNVTVLCILINTFLDSKLEYKIFCTEQQQTFCTEQQQTFPEFNLHIISSSTLFSFFVLSFPTALFENIG